MITLDELIGLNLSVCSDANEPSVMINENNLLSALSVQDWYEEDELLASALVRSLTIAHGFQDGNKRTAALVGDYICPYLCSEDDLISCILDIATGKLKDVTEIANILYQRNEDPGYIGIWWIYNDTIIGEGCPVDEGVLDKGYIQFSTSKNHITQWNEVIKEQVPEAANNLISKGFRSLERGRVVYNPKSQIYEILCGEQIAKNSRLIYKIAKEFNIADKRYEINVSKHYYVPTLTGNPALDNFDFD